MNLMPCVLPVLGLKLMAFATPGKKLPYLLGVWVSFLVLATVAVAMGAGMSHMSYPLFRGGLAVVCIAMSTNLLGLWTMPSFRVPGAGSVGPFGTGVLTVALGSSCSVPFLAPALAYCAAEGAAATYGIFSCIALGFVSPFLLPLPLPKPGAWMVKFERVCGGLLGAVALWLILTLGGVENGSIPTGDRAIVVTADWCINCPIAHRAWTDRVHQELGFQHTVLDWTNRDPEITRFLESWDHQSVPFALIELNGQVFTFSGIYTESDLLEAIHKAQ